MILSFSLTSVLECRAARLAVSSLTATTCVLKPELSHSKALIFLVCLTTPGLGQSETLDHFMKNNRISTTLCSKHILIYVARKHPELTNVLIVLIYQLSLHGGQEMQKVSHITSLSPMCLQTKMFIS